MRIAVVLLTIVLVAALGAIPVSSATKYKPCSLLADADLETALGAKLITGVLRRVEGEDIQTDGPLQGQPLDHCTWQMKAGQLTIVATLYVARAIGPLPQLAAQWYPPKEELVKEAGAKVESIRLPGAECRIFKNLKLPDFPGVFHETSCLGTSKGMAVSLEVTTQAKTPATPQLVKKLLDRASSRLP